jgi:hypothetical protein
MSNANARVANASPSAEADDGGRDGATAAVPSTSAPAAAIAPPPLVASTLSAPLASVGGAGSSAVALPATATAEAVAGKSVPPFLFVLNFIVLGAVLTGVLAWFFFYTNWFEGLVTLLGLGGLLGGIATLLSAVSKDRVEAVQEWVTKTIFDRHRTWIIALALGVIFLLAASFVGTIQVDHQIGGYVWLVRIARAGQVLPPADEAEQISTGGRLRELYCMWPWQSTEVQIKVSGLPLQTQTIRPWSRKRVACPASFLRPIVLIGANRTALDSEKKLTLVVKVDGVECYHAAYRRTIVILGSAEADVAYPAGLAGVDAWKDVLTDVKLAEKLRPAAALRLDRRLLPQQQVTAQMLDSDGKLYCESNLIVVQPTDVSGLVQDMMLIRK